MAKRTDVRQDPGFKGEKSSPVKCFRWGCEYRDTGDLHKEEDSLPLTFTMSICRGEPMTRVPRQDPSRDSTVSEKNRRPRLRQRPRPLPKIPATDKGEAPKQELWDDGAHSA